MKKNRLWGVALLMLATTSWAAQGNARDAFLGMESEMLEAIGLYPTPIRKAVLEASAHPEVIVKVSMLQARASARFEELIGDLPRADQEAMWDLTRFPDLLALLVEGDIKKKSEIRQISAGYPKRIQEIAVEYGRREFDALTRIHKLNLGTERQFSALLEEYATATRSAFEKLIAQPEVMTILEEDMSLTILLGDAYRRDPEGVRERAAELSLEMAMAHAAEVSALTEELEEVDPVAASRFADVAAAYRERYALDAGEPEVTTEVEVRSYYGRPYAYWYGYPRHYYGGYGYNASLGWYITPNVFASFNFHPTLSRRHYAPRHHIATWSRAHRAPSRAFVSRGGRRSRRGH